MRGAFPAPDSFKRAHQMVSRAGHDVAECLVAFFFGTETELLPWHEVQRFSQHEMWNFKDFVELHGSSQEPSPQARAPAMTGDICTEMEMRSLTYSRKLQCYIEHGMPWLGTVMARLPLQMGKQTVFKVLLCKRCGDDPKRHQLQAPAFSYH